jgi:carbohydrate-selective porin OprB
VDTNRCHPTPLRAGASFAICLAALLFDFSGTAQAQVGENLPRPEVPTNSTLAQNLIPENPQGMPINPGTNNETVPTPEFPAQIQPGLEGNQEGYFFSLQSAGKSIGQELQSNGIYLGGSYTALYGNVTGGNQNGQGYNGDAFIGADLDLNKILWIEGAALHFYVDDRQGGWFAKFTGSHYTQPQIFGPNANFRLEELSWDQSLFNDHVRFLVGRIDPTTDFDFSPIYCNFISTSVCPNAGPLIFDTAVGAAPVSEWGGRLTLKPTLQTYFRIGAYEDDAFESPGNGFNWSTSRATGEMIPVQVGYETNFDNDAYPRAYDIGAYYDNNTYNDPLYNAFGLPLAVYGGVPMQDPNRTAAWVQAQQMIYRPDMNSHRGLTVFSNLMWETSGVAPIRGYYMAGFEDIGPIASRPHDMLNFAATVYSLNGRYQEALSQEIGGNGHAPNTEEMFELNYGILLAPGVNCQPYVQYLINPDQANVNYSPTRDRLPNSITTGIQLTIALNDLLGLPAFVRGN